MASNVFATPPRSNNGPTIAAMAVRVRRLRKSMEGARALCMQTQQQCINGTISFEAAQERLPGLFEMAARDQHDLAAAEACLRQAFEAAGGVPDSPTPSTPTGAKRAWDTPEHPAPIFFEESSVRSQKKSRLAAPSLKRPRSIFDTAYWSGDRAETQPPKIRRFMSEAEIAADAEEAARAEQQRKADEAIRKATWAQHRAERERQEAIDRAEAAEKRAADADMLRRMRGMCGPDAKLPSGPPPVDDGSFQIEAEKRYRETKARVNRTVKYEIARDSNQLPVPINGKRRQDSPPEHASSPHDKKRDLPSIGRAEEAEYRAALGAAEARKAAERRARLDKMKKKGRHEEDEL